MYASMVIYLCIHPLNGIKIKMRKILRSMEFIKKKSLVVPVNEEIVENAVGIALSNNLPLVDSLIYATALLHKRRLVTCDNDFRGLENVEILDV